MSSLDKKEQHLKIPTSSNLLQCYLWTDLNIFGHLLLCIVKVSLVYGSEILDILNFHIHFVYFFWHCYLRVSFSTIISKKNPCWKTSLVVGSIIFGYAGILPVSYFRLSDKLTVKSFVKLIIGGENNNNLIKLLKKNMTTRFKHISAYYQVMSNHETISLLQVHKFSNIKTWQWCLKRNKPTRLNKLLWNEPDIFKILYRISKKVQNINWRLSLISNKNFLFSWAKILKLSKQGK